MFSMTSHQSTVQPLKIKKFFLNVFPVSSKIVQVFTKTIYPYNAKNMPTTRIVSRANGRLIEVEKVSTYFGESGLNVEDVLLGKKFYLLASYSEGSCRVAQKTSYIILLLNSRSRSLFLHGILCSNVGLYPTHYKTETILQEVCRIKRFSSKRTKRDEQALTPFSSENLWPNGVVYYRFNEGYFSPEAQVPILAAMRRLEERTCVRFVPVNSNFDQTHLHITYGQYCSSFVGRQPSVVAQDVTLPPQCLKERGAVHELIHALGFGHEQTRGDRDNYVEVHWKNIPDPFWFTFEEDRDGHYLLKYAVPYDYLSIMHYGPFDFAIDKRVPTLVSTNSFFFVPVNQQVSALDVMKINLLYNCQDQLRNHLRECVDLMPNCHAVPEEDCRKWSYLAQVCRQRCRICTPQL